jgi:hypothetical protein
VCAIEAATFLVCVLSQDVREGIGVLFFFFLLCHDYVDTAYPAVVF